MCQLSAARTLPIIVLNGELAFLSSKTEAVNNHRSARALIPLHSRARPTVHSLPVFLTPQPRAKGSGATDPQRPPFAVFADTLTGRTLLPPPGPFQSRKRFSEWR